MDINKIEKILDEVNADYDLRSDEKMLCIFCKSKDYNSQVGIIHKTDCIIQELRDEIRNSKKVCKW